MALDGIDTTLEDNIDCASTSVVPHIFIFTKISDFVVRCMYRMGHTQVIHYLDDF